MIFKLETKQETIVIFTFHIVATCMELFKTSDSIGAWQYPEATMFSIGAVPLFAGFMYSAVGSYFARSWRLFRVRFKNYPPFWTTVLLAVLIYANFFTHHYTVDIRYWLFVMTGILFGRTWLFHTVSEKERKIPL
ncbi:UNVERIFIED_CONTAM: hypothetical protein GTU68_004776, partial [Idotea baltica]|nr:hypothetical protein [Idotea baltica]